MSRTRLLTAVTATLALAAPSVALAAPSVALAAPSVALAAPSVALAAPTAITGGTAQLTLSTAAQSLLSANHLTVTPLAPATASGATFTYPIAGGHINTTTLRGVIRTRGGFTISNGTRTVRVRRLTIESRKHQAWVFGLVRSSTAHGCAASRAHGRAGHCRIVIRWTVRRLAHVTGVTLTGGTASGTAQLTAFAAKGINALAGSHVVTAGAPLGTVTAQPVLG